jgi:PTS system nitrogen regulatory IIA component
MNQVAALLPLSNVVVDLDVPSKAAFFAAIGEVFERSVGLPKASVAASLAAREKLG